MAAESLYRYPLPLFRSVQFCFPFSRDMGRLQLLWKKDRNPAYGKMRRLLERLRKAFKKAGLDRELQLYLQE